MLLIVCLLTPFLCHKHIFLYDSSRSSQSQNALSHTKAMLTDSQEKLTKLEEESTKVMDSADSALKQQLRLANESKAELEAMTNARVKSLTTSLELMETNLRENNEHLQRVQDRSQVRARERRMVREERSDEDCDRREERSGEAAANVPATR